MKIYTEVTDNRGASPVIGVILIVAVTVILAATIGSFVLGTGNQGTEPAPQTSFSYDFDGQTKVTITHDSGESIDASRIEVTVGGAEAYPEPNTTATNITDATGWNETISAGSQLELFNDSGTTIAEGDDTIRVIWNNPSGGSSNAISEREWPN